MRRTRRLSLAGLALALVSLLALVAGISQAADFANPAFQKVWSQTDSAVKEGKASRTWIWGPTPGVATQEPYAEAPGGLRLVQYFDKSRMEINNPSADPNSAYYVTNGLLAKELVSGQLQTGNNRYEPRNPAQVPVAGDPENAGPTYATFAGIASLNNNNRVEKKSGFITQTIDRNGQFGTTTTAGNYANYAYYDENLGHNIPDVFYGTFLLWKSQLNLDWVYVLGLPLTDPYWSTFKVAGVDRDVLVQIYERRALTYTPSNSPAYQVEMGNIGQHYYKWRYPEGVTTTAATNPANTTASGTTSAATNTTPPATTPPVTTAPATTAVPTSQSTTPVASTGPTTPSSGQLDQEEGQLLNLINQYRASQGLGALAVDATLTTAAKWLSTDMANKNYFSHTDSQGRDMGPRLTAFGYTRYPQGENIAAGYTTSQQVFDGWKGSPGHNANMLGKDYKYIGLGRAYNASSTYKWYWTIDLGG